MKPIPFYGLLFFAWLLVFSCSPDRRQPPPIQATGNKHISPPVILLANLPDSSKPVVTFLNDVRKPKTVRITKPPQVHSFIDSLTHRPLAPEAQGMGLFTNFTSDQGLGDGAVTCAVMDKIGQLWFGTNGGGVSSYDGKRFTTYSTNQGLADKGVWSITTDKKGDIWMGTNNGVSRFDGKKFTNYKTEQLLVDKGNLRFTPLGGSFYNMKEFNNYTNQQGLIDNVVYTNQQGLVDNVVGSIKTIFDKKGNLWVGMKNGLGRFDGKKFTNYTTEQGLANNFIGSIAEDKKGIIWIGTWGGGISRFDGEKFTNYTTKQGLVSNVIYSIVADKTGNLWFGTRNGVSRFDGKDFTNYTTAQRLDSDFVLSIVEDTAGSLWFGTASDGVSRYDGKSWINYTTKQGLADNIILSIQEDKRGNLWLGTSNKGVIRYDGKRFTTYATAQGLAYDMVNCIAADKRGNLWFGTAKSRGVSRFDGKEFTNYTAKQGLAGEFIQQILEDKTGNLWFGTDQGVSQFDGKRFTNYSTRQGLVNNYVRSIWEDKRGNLWFGTEKGVSRFDGKGFTNYTTAQGLPGNTIYSLLEDKDRNLWFATDNGLSRFDGRTFANYTTKEGLPGDVITEIITDANSTILIGTNKGLGVLTGFKPKSTKEKTPDSISPQNLLSNEALKNYTLQLEIYNTATGYPIKEINSMVCDSKGIIWIGTASDKTGLVRFDYLAVHKDKNPPRLVLQGIKINNEAIGWQSLHTKPTVKASTGDSTAIAPNVTEEVTTFGKALSEAERDTMRYKFGDIQFDGVRNWYPIPENLVLPYTHNTITFDFAAIETTRPSMVNYQYILEGYDDGWSSITNKTSANFGNMSEGNYTFKLKAQSPSGVWGQPLTYSFRVLPPWWRTWWAYAFYALLGGLAIWSLIAYRSRELQRKNRALEEKVQALEEIKNALLNGQKIERRRVAADLHDNLGGMMSAIRLSIEAMDASAFTKTERQVYQKVLNLTRQAYTDVRLLAHNLLPEELETFGLAEALQRLMNKLNDSQPIHFSLQMNDLERLPKDLEFNLYSICLELTNNIVRHSGATEASFEFISRGNQFQLLVTDNGKGFIRNNTSDGMGMRTIQERTAQMGGVLKIHSRPGEGTLIQFIIPFTSPAHASGQT